MTRSSDSPMASEPWEQGRSVRLALLLQAFGREFKATFPFPWSLALLAYVAFVAPLAWLLGFPSLPSNLDPLYYLLSAQAQTLGAILALVFSLTLVAAQLATKYSYRILPGIFGRWILYYLIPYIFSVVVPLFLLNGNLTIDSARLSLILAGFCLVLLLPYYTALRERLSLRSAVLSLREELAAKHDTMLLKQPGRLTIAQPQPEALTTLDNIATSALEAHDYDAFELAVEAIRDVDTRLAFWPSRGANKEDVEKLMEPVLKRLHIMSRLEATKLRSKYVVSGHLTMVGINAAHQGLAGSGRNAVRLLGRAGESFTRAGLLEAVQDSINCLNVVAGSCLHYDPSIYQLAVQALWVIGAVAMSKTPKLEEVCLECSISLASKTDAEEILDRLLTTPTDEMKIALRTFREWHSARLRSRALP